MGELKAEMAERGLQWAITGAPVSIREQSDVTFATQLRGLDTAAKAWRAAGVTRVKTAVISFSDNLNYLQNFRLHTERVKRVGGLLDVYGLRFGLEYLGR